jgi:hypothetical protein
VDQVGVEGGDKEEQQRENEAQKAREQELEQQRRIALVDAVQKKFLNTLDGTMASLLTFLDGYKYESAKQETANTIVGNYLRSRSSTIAWMMTSVFAC